MSSSDKDKKEEAVGIVETFFPDELYDQVYAIPFADWYEKGYRGVLFDIDNTLVPHGADADEKSVRFFEGLRSMGFQTMLMSNNKEERVRRFAKPVGSPYIFKAGKPMAASYLKAMDRMGTDEKTTIFVGDQLFTDVWGAKRLGIPALLVRPIDSKEEIQIVLKRYLERIILFYYHKQKDERRKGRRKG